jgi:hypothetical protein
MPKDGSMTIGAGVDGRPYISDPIKERIAMPGPSYNPGPEQLDAVRREIRAELDKTQAAIEREAKYAVGTEKIAAERRRQVEKEGWTPEHDAEHADGALIKAAVTYAREALWAVQHPDVEFDPTLALTIRDHQGTPASTWPTLRRRRDPPRLGLTTRPCPDCTHWHALFEVEEIQEVGATVVTVREWHEVDCPIWTEANG